MLLLLLLMFQQQQLLLLLLLGVDALVLDEGNLGGEQFRTPARLHGRLNEFL